MPKARPEKKVKFVKAMVEALLLASSSLLLTPTADQALLSWPRFSNSLSSATVVATVNGALGTFVFANPSSISVCYVFYVKAESWCLDVFGAGLVCAMSAFDDGSGGVLCWKENNSFLLLAFRSLCLRKQAKYRDIDLIQSLPSNQSIAVRNLPGA